VPQAAGSDMSKFLDTGLDDPLEVVVWHGQLLPYHKPAQPCQAPKAVLPGQLIGFPFAAKCCSGCREGWAYFQHWNQ